MKPKFDQAFVDAPAPAIKCTTPPVPGRHNAQIHVIPSSEDVCHALTAHAQDERISYSYDAIYKLFNRHFVSTVPYAEENRVDRVIHLKDGNLYCDLLLTPELMLMVSLFFLGSAEK